MEACLRKVLPIPAKLVERGRFNFGTYNMPFRYVNPHDSGNGFFRKMKLKEWQHFALVNNDYYITLVLFDAKKMCFAQVCIYDRKTHTFNYRERKALSWNITLPMTLFNSRAEFHKKDMTLNFFNELDHGRHRIEFDIGATPNFPSVKVQFTLFEDTNTCEPIVVCLPLGKKDAMYSHKFISSLEGSLTLDHKDIHFSKQDSYSLIDIHKGYYPYVMKWYWASGGGYAGKKLIGFNLTDNQVEDQENYNENCIWINQKLHLLPPVFFTFDRKDRMKPWMIKDHLGMVDLVFVPEGIRQVDMNALIVKNRYRAPFGQFYGKIKTKDGELVIIQGFFGMCEDMYLRA